MRRSSTITSAQAAQGDLVDELNQSLPLIDTDSANIDRPVTESLTLNKEDTSETKHFPVIPNAPLAAADDLNSAIIFNTEINNDPSASLDIEYNELSFYWISDFDSHLHVDVSRSQENSDGETLQTESLFLFNGANLPPTSTLGILPDQYISPTDAAGNYIDTHAPSTSGEPSIRDQETNSDATTANQRQIDNLDEICKYDNGLAIRLSPTPN